MLSFLRIHVLAAAAMFAVAMMLVPASAQAQTCSVAGDKCPITGGSLRTVVGGGFIIPQLTIFASQSGPINGKPLTFGNTAMGFILPTPSAEVTIVARPTPANPMSTSPQPFNVPLGQMTYGDATVVTPLFNQPVMGARHSTPFLVQVPLYPAPSHALFGVSTNIGQSFPGVTATYMNGALTENFGGPAEFRKNGRPGMPVINHCAGGYVPPAPIPPTWDGGCFMSTPLNSVGNPLPKIAPVTIKYSRTANQFGGRASQKQIKRTSQAGVPPIGNNWLGRIRFNRFAPAPYTSVEMLDSVNPKSYPTLEQGLVEPAAWGDNFGKLLRRIGAVVPPGDLVTGRVTPAGRPVNILTQVLKPGGTSAGAGAQTSTTWGGPMTTGQVIVNAKNVGLSSTIFTRTGSDQRTVGGMGQVSMVSGTASLRTSPPPFPPQGGQEQTMLTIKLPEPSMALGLIAGASLLAGVSRRRKN
jgi:hypothetical protein